MERKSLEKRGADDSEVVEIVNASFMLEILDRLFPGSDADEHWQGSDDQEKKGGG